MTRIHKNREYYSNTEWTVRKVRKEINDGLSLLKGINKDIITIFGSHRVKPDNKYYRHCRKTAFELGKKGYSIITGGGPGIMHAANSGAKGAGAPSIGLRAELLKGEKVGDPIFTEEMSFHFMFVRRFIMSIKSEALIFYPGGFGALNELFEYLVLMQTDIVDKVPIICVNSDYWQGLFDWIKNNPLKEDFLINDDKDMKLIHFADSPEEILEIIEK